MINYNQVINDLLVCIDWTQGEDTQHCCLNWLDIDSRSEINYCLIMIGELLQPLVTKIFDRRQSKKSKITGSIYWSDYRYYYVNLRHQICHEPYFSFYPRQGEKFIIRNGYNDNQVYEEDDYSYEQAIHWCLSELRTLRIWLENVPAKQYID